MASRCRSEWRREGQIPEDALKDRHGQRRLGGFQRINAEQIAPGKVRGRQRVAIALIGQHELAFVIRTPECIGPPAPLHAHSRVRQSQSTDKLRCVRETRELTLARDWPGGFAPLTPWPAETQCAKAALARRLVQHSFSGCRASGGQRRRLGRTTRRTTGLERVGTRSLAGCTRHRRYGHPRTTSAAMSN